MTEFTEQVREIARRHQLSEASVTQLANGLLSAGGGQLQFNLPEFGGMGQWMPGMVMAGDMFNHRLRAYVDSVCSDIAGLVRSGQLWRPTTSSGGGGTGVSWSAPAQWWPGDLGIPATSGAQNNLRYAWFSTARRLAVDLGGNVSVYDTGDHQIGGVSQQQSGAGMTLTFTSQYGVIQLSSLPRVDHDKGATTQCDSIVPPYLAQSLFILAFSALQVLGAGGGRHRMLMKLIPRSPTFRVKF